jgi:hypothetical protein
VLLNKLSRSQQIKVISIFAFAGLLRVHDMLQQQLGSASCSRLLLLGGDRQAVSPDPSAPFLTVLLTR